MKPAHAFAPEKSVPIDFAHLELRNRGQPPVRARARAAAAVAALDEIESVAHLPADAVKGHPLDVRYIHAALQHKIFDEPANRVVGKSGDGGSLQSKTAPKATHDIILAPAFPDLEFAGGVDASVARIEPEHDFAERGGVPPARAGWLDDQFFVFHTLEYPKKWRHEPC